VIPRRAAEAGTGTASWLDDRLHAAKVVRNALNKIFPDHWSFMLGEIALYSFIILVLTGIYLTFFFDPSLHTVVYHGSYAPLRGQKMSAAYESTVNLSLSVRGGLLMRQMHHWAANVFIAAIVVHMCRIFFTGAFRRPRELNWVIGVTLLILAISNGFLGYSLPDDLVSGTGLRIMFSFLLSIPVVGTYLAYFLFNGNFPGDTFDFRFYILHVLVIPLVIIALIAVHLGLLVHHKHTQFPGEGRTERNVVGAPMWPNFALKSQGFFLMIFGGLALLAGFAQINPIWIYGPYIPYKVTYAVQPDWYMGWLDGALRLMPSWEIVLPGHMVPNAFFPAVLLPGLTFTLFYLWPWIEDRFTKESREEHHLLDLPRNRPVRTAIGSGVLAFYFVLFLGSSTDVFANFFGISLNAVLWSLRFILIGLPPIVGYVAYKICKELAKVPTAGQRKVPMVVLRTPEGAYVTEPADMRPGDQLPELEPVPVDAAVVVGPAEPEGAAAASTGRSTAAGVGAGAGGSQATSSSGVYRAPRGPSLSGGGGGLWPFSRRRPEGQP
jgi:ubiquinol-cytochrome c reductase cytochrome b subunit